MYIKIHTDEKIIHLCDALTPVLNTLVKDKQYRLLEADETFTAAAVWQALQGAAAGAVVYHASLPALKKMFFKKIKEIHAGGGLVQNEKGEILLIFRRGYWDLPKGKLDAGETLEACAVREVMEETGLTHLKPGAPIITTYHTYMLKKNLVAKVSHWYHMQAASTAPLVPQTEEDITAIKWVPKDRLHLYKTQMYGTIADVLDHA